MARRKVQRNHCRCFPTGFAAGLTSIFIVVFVIVFITIIVIVFVIAFIIAFIISISSLITIMITVYFGRNGLPPSRPHHWICPSSSQTHFPTLTSLHFRDFYFKHHHEPRSIFVKVSKWAIITTITIMWNLFAQIVPGSEPPRVLHLLPWLSSTGDCCRIFWGWLSKCREA